MIVIRRQLIAFPAVEAGVSDEIRRGVSGPDRRLLSASIPDVAPNRHPVLFLVLVCHLGSARLYENLITC